MIDNESPRRTAQSFEIRRIAGTDDQYDLLVDGEVLPWDFVGLAAVETDDAPPNLKYVHLALVVDGDVIVDPSVETIDRGDIVHHLRPDTEETDS